MLENIKENAWMFFVEGILLVVLGLSAIGLPQLATFSIGLIIGSILIITGIATTFRAFKFKEEKDLFWPAFFSGLIGILAGVFTFKYLEQSIYFLTMLLVLYLGFEAIAKIAAAQILKPLKNSGAILVSGIVTLVLALVIMSALPESSEWILGLIFGINLSISGLSFILLAMGLKYRDKKL